MEEKLVSLMMDKKVYEAAKDYCHKKNIKIKYFISEAIMKALNSKGDKNGLKS